MDKLQTVFGMQKDMAGSMEAHGPILFPGGIGRDRMEALSSLGEGTRLRERAGIELTTGFHESRLYRAAVEELLSGMDRTLPVLDLGMGDGRITAMILGMGFEHVMAVDYHPVPMQRFHQSLEPGWQEHVTLLCSDFSRLAFEPGSFGAIVSIEALCYLNGGFDAFLSTLNGWLRDDGILVHSEPSVEGALTYALCTHNIDHVAGVLDRRRTASANGPEYRVFLLDELQAIQRKSGFEPFLAGFTPVVNAIAAGAIGASGLGEGERLRLLRLARGVPALAAPRCYISKLSKRQ